VGKRVIGTRLVTTNKGSPSEPCYRSRLVAQEVKKGSLAEHFAAMPPLAALKSLLQIAVTKNLPDRKGKMRRESEKLVLGFLDVKRAHFCSKATRELYVELPEECGQPKGKVGLLRRSMYGCRDAGFNWEQCAVAFMKGISFSPGKADPCIYHHETRNLRAVVRGDDFTSLGSVDNVNWFHAQAQGEWKVVVRGVMGPPPKHRDVSTVCQS